MVTIYLFTLNMIDQIGFNEALEIIAKQKA